MNILSFLKNRINQKNAIEDESENIITGTVRDYSEIVKYDVALKIWIPEAIDIALKEMSDFSNTSVSTLLRQTLYTYLYGSYDQMWAIEQHLDKFITEGNLLPANLSCDLAGLELGADKKKENKKSSLGKNTYDIKVWIAQKMKNDLQELADRAGIKLSSFIREVLISKLFGHTYLSEREAMLKFRVEVDST